MTRTAVVPDQDALLDAAGHLAAWREVNVVAVIPIAVPDGGPPETVPGAVFFAMADDREAGPGSAAASLNAAADCADMIARHLLAGRPGITAWARVERSGAYAVIWERQPRSHAGGPDGITPGSPAAGAAREEG